MEPKKLKTPCKNKNIFFMNYHKQLMAPFVIYADFECITVPINESMEITLNHIKNIRLVVMDIK